MLSSLNKENESNLISSASDANKKSAPSDNVHSKEDLLSLSLSYSSSSANTTPSKTPLNKTLNSSSGKQKEPANHISEADNSNGIRIDELLKLVNSTSIFTNNNSSMHSVRRSDM
jgi:hypothetical protein